MRISGLFIDGFGLFNGVEVKDLPGGLVIFHGANEAGKSTCLAFVHTVLFGFLDAQIAHCVATLRRLCLNELLSSIGGQESMLIRLFDEVSRLSVTN